MKNKKQSYEFGNSNYRKMKVAATENKTWIHLEKDDEGNLLIFMAHPDEIDSCFKEKQMGLELEADFHHFIIFKLMGKSRYDDESETWKKLTTACPGFHKIDDYFRKVTLLSDREYMGWQLPDDAFMAAITC